MYGVLQSAFYSAKPSYMIENSTVNFILLQEPNDLLFKLLFRGSYPNTTESDNLHINANFQPINALILFLGPAAWSLELKSVSVPFAYSRQLHVPRSPHFTVFQMYLVGVAGTAKWLSVSLACGGNPWVQFLS